jgi:hypothetical protein
MKSAVSCDVTPCRPVLFGETTGLYLLLTYFLLIKCLAYSSVLKMEAVLPLKRQ